MTRATYRFRDYTIGPDTEPDAEPVRHRMECAVCDAVGPPAETADAASPWMVAHLKAFPEHLTYRELISRPYRAVPGAWR